MPNAANAIPRGGQSESELIQCSFDCETKSVNLEERTVDVIMSTPRIDRHRERVAPDWSAETFSRSHPVLYAHNSHILPIGKTENVRLEGGKLVGTIRFASAAANQMAESCLLLFKEGCLDSVSIGFTSSGHRWEKDGDEEILVLLQNDLLELSCTPTPANQDCVARRRAKALAERDKTVVPGTNAVLASGAYGTLEPGDTTLWQHVGFAARPAVANSASTEAVPLPYEQPIPPAKKNGGGRVTLHKDGSITLYTPTPASLSGSPTNNEKDPNMDIKELEARVAVLTSEKATAEKQAAEVQKNLDAERVAFKETIDRLKTEASAHEAQVKAITADRDSHKERGDKLEADGIEREVEALVGKKISPAEKPLYVSLRKTSPDLFTKMVNERPDLKLTEQVVPAEKTNGASGNASIDLFNEVKKSAGL